MKKIVLVATGVFFLTCLTAIAWNGDRDMQMGMKGHGMMRGSMDEMPCTMIKDTAMMQKSMIMANLLPEMDQQLSLSEDQVSQLIDLRSGFKKQQADYQAEMTKKNRKLQALINDDAPVDQVRNQMKACADIRVDMHSAAYQTEREMMALLTDEQKEKLKTIMEEHDAMMEKGTLKN